MTQKRIEQCNEPELPDFPSEPPSPYCNDDVSSLKDVDSAPDYGWLQRAVDQKKTGFGSEALCDPMLKGKILNDLSPPDRSTIYRYSRALRGCDEAVQDLFRSVIVIDENEKAWPIPLIWATQERAVVEILKPNTRKDNSLVVDKIRLPHMAIYANSYNFDPSRYIYHKAVNYLRGADGKPGFTIREKYDRDTVFGISAGIPVDVSYSLWVWTLYQEDMNQIFEQIMPKIAPMGYIRVRGVPWETTVSLDSISNAVDTNPGEKSLRVFKYQFDMTAKTYIPQPITRKKAVLKTRVEIVEGIDENHINAVIARLETAVKELEE